MEKFEIFCFKAFVCEGAFYYQINKKDINKLILSRNDGENNLSNKKSVDKLRWLNYLFNAIPKLKLKQLYIDYAIKFDDAMKDAVFGGAVTAFVDAVVNGSSKLEIEDFAIDNVATKDSFRGVCVNCKPGLAVFSIIAYGIRVMLSKRKFTVRA